MAKPKQVYVRGSQGTKPTPTQMIPKPLPVFVQSQRIDLFQGSGNRGKVGMGVGKSRGNKAK